MKKIVLLFTVFCFFAFPVLNAQANKGKILVGISSTVNLNHGGSDIMGLGFSSTKYVSASGNASDTYKSSFINLIPKVGYFIIENLAAGLDMTIGSSTTKYSGNKSIESLLCVGPFARYYVPVPLDKFIPFAELNVGIGGIKSKTVPSGSGSGSEHKSGLFLFGIWAGMSMPLGDRVSFDAMLGYNHVTYSTKATSETGGSSGKDKEKVGTVGLKMGFVVFFDMKK